MQSEIVTSKRLGQFKVSNGWFSLLLLTLVKCPSIQSTSTDPKFSMSLVVPGLDLKRVGKLKFSEKIELEPHSHLSRNLWKLMPVPGR